MIYDKLEKIRVPAAQQYDNSTIICISIWTVPVNCTVHNAQPRSLICYCYITGRVTAGAAHWCVMMGRVSGAGRGARGSPQRVYQRDTQRRGLIYLSVLAGDRG